MAKMKESYGRQEEMAVFIQKVYQRHDIDQALSMVMEELLRGKEPAIRSYGVWQYWKERIDLGSSHVAGGFADLFVESEHFLSQDLFQWPQTQFLVDSKEEIIRLKEKGRKPPFSLRIFQNELILLRKKSWLNLKKSVYFQSDESLTEIEKSCLCWGTKLMLQGQVEEGYFNKGSFTLSDYGLRLHRSGCLQIGRFRPESSLMEGVGHRVTTTPSTIYFGQFKRSLFDGIGRLLRQDGTLYRGRFKVGFQDGPGAQTRDDFQFSGNFVKGLRDGRGYLQDTKNGYVYDGNWSKGQRLGTGKQMWSKNLTGGASQYQGQFAHNTRHGKGTMVFKDGTTYVGDWAYGRRQGQGVLHGEKVFCKGEWKSDLLNGTGQMERHGEWIYKGEFLNGRMEGMGYQGLLRNDSGQVYEAYRGKFIANKRGGQGRVMRSCGFIYNGQWKAGKPHGIGFDRRPICCIQTSAAQIQQHAKFQSNFQIYRGQFENGVYQGKGCLSFIDGSQYRGDFKNGKQHGFGRLVERDGASLFGHWVDGLAHGWLCKRFAIGDVYEGQWVKGQQQGYGKFVRVNGWIYQGQWKDGKMHGNGTLSNKSTTYSGLFENDEYAGPALLPKSFESERKLNEQEIQKPPQRIDLIWSGKYEMREEPKFQEMLI